MSREAATGDSFVNSFAIVPAAGRSRRMGTPKLCLPWRGQTLIQFVLDQWQAGGVTQIVVVAAPDDTQLQTLVRSRPSVELLIPATPPREMKDSVRLALEAIATRHSPAPADVWLLAPADLPNLNPHTIQRLLSAHDPLRPTILVPVAEGRRGHPVLFPWTLAQEVAKLPADQGVNALLKQAAYREVAGGSATDFLDLDSPDDYQQWLAQQDSADEQRPI